MAVAAAIAALPASATSQIAPPQPYEFDLVNLRMTVDSCAFAPESVAVSSDQGVIRVVYRLNYCLVAGEPRVVDIRLGTLPIGDWYVEAHPDGNPAGPYSERILFAVRHRPQIAIFPAPPRPLTDYSGMWYKPAESGWGLSFHQSSTNVVFAAWYVYDATGNPVWYTIQEGQWENSTRWAGTVYRTSGPPFFAPSFDASLVSYSRAGEANLEFAQRPGEEGFATFTYTVDGRPGNKRIVRLAF